MGLGTYQDIQDERDRLENNNALLEERVRMLELSNENLDSERARLMEETEDLLEVRARLEKDVASLRSTETELSESLSATEAELSKQAEEVSRLRGTYESLVEDLESEVASGQIEIEQLREGIRLNVSDEILFGSGSATLDGEGVAVLRKVAGQLVDIPHRVEVQGHTDDLPIRGPLTRRFPTNWELAASRASSVVRLLQTEGVSGDRLTAVSFAEFHPVVPNETPDDRALNRRIEIRLLPPQKGELPPAGSEEPAEAESPPEPEAGEEAATDTP